MQLSGKFFRTRLDVPTKQLLPISQPPSITAFGAIQQPSPTVARPQTITPAVI